jgi:hypothetical protein
MSPARAIRRASSSRVSWVTTSNRAALAATATASARAASTGSVSELADAETSRGTESSCVVPEGCFRDDRRRLARTSEQIRFPSGPTSRFDERRDNARLLRDRVPIPDPPRCLRRFGPFVLRLPCKSQGGDHPADEGDCPLVERVWPTALGLFRAVHDHRVAVWHKSTQPCSLRRARQGDLQATGNALRSVRAEGSTISVRTWRRSRRLCASPSTP